MSLDKLRSLPEFANASDAEILGALSKTAGVPLYDVASAFGQDSGGKWGQRLSASVDSYQANLLGLGEALTGSETLGLARRRNEAEANLSRSIAAQRGAISSYKDVNSFGDAADYVGGLAVDSLPYLGEALVGGLTGGSSVVAGRLARLGLSPAAARTVGGAAASYPSAVADILANQREAGGEVDLGAAAVGGVPYAALNALGLEGAVARRGFARTGLKALDDMTGVTGGVARAAVNGVVGGVSEGFSEAGQEVINQGFGRMAMDPNASLTDPDAIERYKESFVGGMALGGTVNASMGGWRRSANYRPVEENAQAGLQTDLLADPPSPPLELGYNPALDDPSQRYVVFPDGTVAMNGEQELNARFGLTPETPAFGKPPVAPVAAEQTTATAQQNAAPDTETPEVDALLEKWGVKPSKARREIAAQVIAEQIDDDQQIATAVAQSKYGIARKAIEEAVKAREPAVIQPAPTEVAGIDPTTTVTIGRKGREETVTPVQLLDKIATASDKDKGRILMALGAEMTTDPTTGQPRIVITQEPRTLDQIAEAESAAAGKKVSRQGIQQSLKKFGITPEVINAVTGVSAQTVSQDELGINPEENGSGFRVETELSKATGQGLVDDGNTLTKEQRVAVEQADAILAQAGPGTALDAGPANAPGAAVTDLRAQNPEVTNTNVRAILAHPFAADAALYWDHDSVTWDELPDTLKADWVDEYVDNFKTNEGDLNEEQLAAAETRIGDDHRRYFQGQQVRAIGSAEAPTSAPNDAGVRVRPGSPSGAAAGKAAAQDVTPKLTPAQQAWDNLRGVYPMVPRWDSLSERQHKQIEDLVARDQFNLAAANTVAGGTTLVNKDVINDEPQIAVNQDVLGSANGDNTSSPQGDSEQASVQRGGEDASSGDAGGRTLQSRQGKLRSQSVASPVRPYTAKTLLEDLKRFVRADALGRNVQVVESFEDLPPEVDRSKLDGKTQAVFRQVGQRTTVYLIANRIEQGEGRAVFLHEVGVHMGLEGMLPTELYQKLADRVRTLAKAFMAGTDKSLSARLAADAASRFQRAHPGTTTATNPELTNSELVAYFVEEAVMQGVNPTAVGKLDAQFSSWFRTLWAAFKTAIRKLGFKDADALTAQDFVDLAYGAARLEVAGTWHGTAAQFRKFNHKFMNTGEGAQAYGWGTYLAQAVGIAKGYWTADVTRKRQGGGIFGRDGTRISPKREAGETFAGLEFAAAQGDLETARRKFAARKMPPEARSRGEAFLDVLESKGATYAPPTEPDGTLMRVDVAIQDNEMLDWDAPLKDQLPEVQAALRAAYKELNYAIDETETGGYMYGVIAEDFRYSDMGTNGKKQASELLLKHGIKGIKFFDANSRTNDRTVTFEGKTYTWDDLVNLTRQRGDGGENGELFVLRDITHQGLAQTRRDLQKAVDERAEMYYKIAMESAERYGVKVDPAKERADAEAEAANTYHGKQLQWLFDNESRIVIGRPQKTRNLVIFNDQDIFRVASHVAAKKDRTLFSKRGDVIAQPTGNDFIDKLPDGLRSLAVSTAYNAKKALTAVMFTRDLLTQAASVLPSAKAYLSSLDKAQVVKQKLERQAAGILDEYSKLSKAEKGTGPLSVNALIKASTSEKKWLFAPDWVQNVKVDENDADVRRFNAMSPEAQKVIKGVFKHGHDSLVSLQRAVIENTQSEFDGTIKALRDQGKEKEAAELEKTKAKSIAEFQELLSMRSGWPYAPLRRFGKFAVVGRSAEYRDAVASNDTKRIKQLESDSDHYYVQFAKSMGEADALRREAEQVFGEGNVDAFERTPDSASLFGGRDMLAALSKIRRSIEAEADLPMPEGTTKQMERVRNNMRQLVSQLYLSALSENSARKGELSRRDIAGADKDMMKAFASQAMATAHFTASLTNGAEMEKHLTDMRQEARNGGNRDLKMRYLNEVLRRRAIDLDYQETPLVDKAMAFTSTYLLTTNPSYFLLNATQPWMMSLPMIAGRHGFFKSAQMLTKSYGEVAKMLKNVKFDEADYTTLPADVRAAVEALADRGVINISLESEMGKFESETGTAAAMMESVNRKIRWATQSVESLNRVTTAIVAYRMERDAQLAEGKSKEQAHAAGIEFADKVIYETHGNYSGYNAPAFMRSGFGRLATQFRKFQLIQATMYARLLQQALKGATKEERAVAIKTLSLNLATLFAAAGTMGMPGFAAVAFILGALDDDEPDDPEATLRRAAESVGMSPWLTDVFTKGAFEALGLGTISGRIGAGNMLSLLPYTDIQMSRDGYADILMGFAGPLAGGVLPRMWDGAGLIAKGDVWKGMEMMAPSGVTNVLKAGRFAVEGDTKRNGDTLLASEDMSALTVAAQAVGLPTTTVTDKQFLSSAQFKADKFFKDKTAQIKREYADAVRDGDSQAMREAREAWQETQQTRKELGYKVQPLSELLKAPQERKKREADTVKGVQFRRTNEGFTRQLAEEM